MQFTSISTSHAPEGLSGTKVEPLESEPMATTIFHTPQAGGPIDQTLDPSTHCTPDHCGRSVYFVEIPIGIKKTTIQIR